MNRFHMMKLVNINLHGVETWECPICKRRILLTWSPKFSKVVIFIGDDKVVHTDTLNKPIPGESPEIELPEADDASLDPFRVWAEEHGIDLS